MKQEKQMGFKKRSNSDRSHAIKELVDGLLEACIFADDVEDHIDWMLGKRPDVPPYFFGSARPPAPVNDHGWTHTEWGWLKRRILYGAAPRYGRKDPRPSGVSEQDGKWALAEHKNLIRNLVDQANALLEGAIR